MRRTEWRCPGCPPEAGEEGDQEFKDIHASLEAHELEAKECFFVVEIDGKLLWSGGTTCASPRHFHRAKCSGALLRNSKDVFLDAASHIFPFAQRHMPPVSSAKQPPLHWSFVSDAVPLRIDLFRTHDDIGLLLYHPRNVSNTYLEQSTFTDRHRGPNSAARALFCYTARQGKLLPMLASGPGIGLDVPVRVGIAYLSPEFRRSKCSSRVSGKTRHRSRSPA